MTGTTTSRSFPLSVPKIDIYQLSKFVYSIWLFTLTDIKTIIALSVCFGLLNMYAGNSFGLKAEPTFLECLQQVPLMLFWVWVNLLPMCIDNQRQPPAIEEDILNKPWRTLPSKRMTPKWAEIIMHIFHGVAIFTSTRIGGLRQCLGLVCLGFWYNRGNGAGSGFIIRNLINGGGYISFLSGAIEVGYGPSMINTRMVKWLVLIGTVIVTTVQTQDMPDQVGDAARSRKTMPLMIGDGPARWATAIMMVVWGLFCPYFWRGGVLSADPSHSDMVVTVLAFVISVQSLVFRSVAADKKTWVLWNFWMVMLYTLPLSSASRKFENRL